MAVLGDVVFFCFLKEQKSTGNHKTTIFFNQDFTFLDWLVLKYNPGSSPCQLVHLIGQEPPSVKHVDVNCEVIIAAILMSVF